MSTVFEKIERLRIRYADDAAMEPRHVFELCQAINTELERHAAQEEESNTVIVKLRAQNAEIERRLDRLERLVGQPPRRG